MIGDARAGRWRPGQGCHWENWSRNGEVCITGMDPTFVGGARLASCLTWLLRSFASHCRRTHDATGEFAFTCASPRMPSTLATMMSMSFDLALCDPQLVQARVRRRGGPVGTRLPALWLEGSVYEYVIGREPFPPVGTPRRRILLLAEERQTFAAASSSSKLTGGARRAWVKGLDSFVDLDDAPVAGILEHEEHAFAVNLLVLVHREPAGAARPRPPLEESFRRHEDLVAALSPEATPRKLSLVWHALWRLPPAMTWTESGVSPWMRYPAVSVLAAVRPILAGKNVRAEEPLGESRGLEFAQDGIPGKA